MPGDRQPAGNEGEERDDHGAPRRTLVIVALACVLILVGGLVVVLRDDGGGGAQRTTTRVTFGPAGDATTIPEPPAGSTPQIDISPDTGPAGSEVTLQGTSFKAGKGFGRIEVFWDRVDGAKLATVDGPRFSVKLRIPVDAELRPDGYNLITVQRTDKGQIISQTGGRFFVLQGRQ